MALEASHEASLTLSSYSLEVAGVGVAELLRLRDMLSRPHLSEVGFIVTVSNFYVITWGCSVVKFVSCINTAIIIN